MVSDPGFRWLTPAAPAAIAVVRAPAIAGLIDRDLPTLGRARFVRVRDVHGQAVDEAVVVRLDADTLELMVHGGPGVRAAVTTALIGHGLAETTSTSMDRWSRLATAAHPAAVRWLLAHRDDETPPFPFVFLHRAPVVLITGPANAGKSTLLNAWCGHRRALVSDVPGTTRDLVAAATVVDGWRLHLLDSAGLRATDDALEHAGQELVAKARAWADVVLYLRPPGDAGELIRPGDIVVQGKADLASKCDYLHWSDRAINRAALLTALGRTVLRTIGIMAEDA
jgi:tRNA U34 5-carboxymethylaminomethyl modifying GTPase MnmE/TrmE